jgi:hypothetical protein
VCSDLSVAAAMKFLCLRDFVNVGLHIALALVRIEQCAENLDRGFHRSRHGIQLGGRNAGAHVRGH